MTTNKTRRHSILTAHLLMSLWILLCSLTQPAFGQKHKVSFKDSLDNKIDLSDWIINAHGFIPVPMIITEPAVGGFGGGLFALFIQPNTPYLDSIDGQLVRTRAKPNMYGAGGMYTANGTWGAGAYSAGEIKSWRTNYRLIAAYADANLNFYKELQNGEEISFEFNIRAMPLYGQLVKHLGVSKWNAGFNYLYLQTKLMRTNAEFHDPKEVDGHISRPGILVEYDKRDNDFTPNKGLRWNTQASTSVEWLGSDYTYQGINSALYAWIPVAPTLYAGLRSEYQQVWGDIPFYLLPFINIRGIPLARYQGTRTFLAETEWRWDFTRRWSAVAFGGGGVAVPEDTSFGDASWHFSGGGGGRYLLARKLGLRAGLDIARGPEDWAYYIVVGSYWIR